MAGSVVHRGGDHWELRISLGYDGNGKQIRRTKRIMATSERAARRELDKFYLETVNAPRQRIKGDMTFGEFAAIWEERYNSKLALMTREIYSARLHGHIMDMFKDIPLEKITAEYILRFVGRISSMGVERTSNGRLSKTSVYLYYRLLKQILDKAVAWGYLAHNPCKDIPNDDKPHPNYHHYPIWQENELQRFLEIMEELPNNSRNLKYKTMFYLGLMTGLRQGELTALTWDAIDWANHTISVNKSQKYLGKDVNEVSDPKTKSSVRRVYMDEYLEDLLKAHEEYQRMFLESEGLRNPSGYVFLAQSLRNGKLAPITPGAMREWLRKICRKHGLPSITVHSLRHMAATYSLSHGAPITAVQSMLGHTNLQTTSIYLHLLDSQQKEPARILANHLKNLRDNTDKGES